MPSSEQVAMDAALRYGGFRNAEETERVTQWAADTIDRYEAALRAISDLDADDFALADPDSVDDPDAVANGLAFQEAQDIAHKALTT